ncbi:MAG: metalloregulator ArsR/SmtB family transcription factor [Armatimonadota bacterium]|nr:metalloregulator ArsR/SmtB family transcription factor [Armatimonadota bacterium]
MEKPEDDLERQTLVGSLRSVDVDSLLLTELAGGEENRFAAEVLAALANPTRLRVLNLLRKQPLSVGQITTSLALTQANASQHLAIMLRAGIVVRESEGTTRRYSLRSSAIPKVLDLLEEFRQAHKEDLAEILE